LPPVLIEIGVIKITVYGLMVALGTVTAIILAYLKASEENLQPDYILEIAIVIGFGSLLLSRTITIIFGVEQTTAFFSASALSFIGAITGGLTGLFFWCRARKMNLIKIGDYLAPYIMLVYAFSKVGCHFSNCCYGLETTLSWAISPGSNPELLLHPVQLYAVTGSLFIFITLLIMQRKKLFVGSILFVLMLLFGLMLIITGMFAFSDVYWLGFSPLQLFGFILILASGLIIFYLYQAGSKKKTTREKKTGEMKNNDREKGS